MGWWNWSAVLRLLLPWLSCSASLISGFDVCARVLPLLLWPYPRGESGLRVLDSMVLALLRHGVGGRTASLAEVGVVVVVGVVAVWWWHWRDFLIGVCPSRHLRSVSRTMHNCDWHTINEAMGRPSRLCRSTRRSLRHREWDILNEAIKWKMPPLEFLCSATTARSLSCCCARLLVKQFY
jgi:hypothetical protein